MQRTDVHRLGSAVLALLLLAAAGHAQSASGPDRVVTPPSATHGGDGVGGIEKTAGQPAGPVGPNSPVTGTGATFGQSLDNEQGWIDLGGQLPADGAASLSATGGATAGSPLELEASGLVPRAPATLVLGTSVANLPFKGGTLVPSPDLLLSGLVLDGQGALLLGATMPEGLPAGLTLCLQLWSPDPSGPKGFAATNALLITVP